MHSSIDFSKSQENLAASHATDLKLLRPSARRGSAAQFRRYVVLLEVLADFSTIVLAVNAGYLAYYSLQLGKHIYYPHKAVFGVASILALVIVLMLDRVGAYARANSLLRVRETEQILRVSIQAFLIAFGISFFASFLISRWLLTLALGFVPLFLF